MARGRAWRWPAAVVALLLVAAGTITALLVVHAGPQGSGPPSVGALTPVGPGVPMSFAPPPTDKPADDDPLAGGRADPFDAGTTSTTIVGDRAYVGGQTEDGKILLSAIDLTTGEPAWPTRDLGRHGNWTGLHLFPTALLVITYPGSYRGLARVFDPRTGELRWQVGNIGVDFVADDTFVAFIDPSDRSIHGHDWASGIERWRIPFDPTGQTKVLRPMPATTSERLGSPGIGVESLPDRRFMTIDPTNTVRVYDVRTGGLLATRTNAASATGRVYSATYTVYDDTLYAADGVTNNSFDPADGAFGPAGVRVNKLSSEDGPRLLYQQAATAVIVGVQPCGADRLCLLTSTSGTTRLVTIGATDGRERWGATVPATAATIRLQGGRLLTNAGQLFDLDGRAVLDLPAIAAGFIKPDTALVLAKATPEGQRVMSVATADGTSVVLGQIPATIGDCAFDEHFLICPTMTGFSAWRFAAG